MADTSIAIKLHDNFSQAIRTMKSNTTPFRRDVEALGEELNRLNGQKVDLKVDMTRAKNELTDAKKAFRELGDQESALRLATAEADYSNISEQLKLVSTQANQTQKDMVAASDAISAADNRAGKMGGQSSALDAVAKAGGIAMLGQAASQAANAMVGSAYGQDAGSMFSSLLSGVTAGAAMGSIIPGIGTAIGAAVGGVGGLINGATSVYGNRDEAFKGTVQSQYDGVQERMANDLTTGSTLAGQRETDQIAFSKLLGGEAIADQYLAQVRDLANRTPLIYGDLTQMSKTMAPAFGDDTSNMLRWITAIGDSGAALGLDVSNMQMVGTAVSRMESTGKTNLEFLNILQERGVDAYGFLAEGLGKSKEEMLEMVSKGLIPGAQAAQLIQEGMEGAYGGAMELQSLTFTGLTSTVEGLTQELQAAMGAGYNTTRKGGLEEQIAYLGGETAGEMKEAYSAIGAWKAEQENERERFEREAMEAMLSSEEYLAAKGQGDQGEMGRLMGKAQVDGLNAYYTSDGYDELMRYQTTLAGDVRESVYQSGSWQNLGYTMGQEMSKGMMAAMREEMPGSIYGWEEYAQKANGGGGAGQKIQAATQAGGGNTIINFHGTTIQKEVDLDRLLDEAGRKAQRWSKAGKF